MLEVTLIDSTDAASASEPALGRCLVAHDKDDGRSFPTRLYYLLLSLCGREGVEELTLNAHAGDNCLRFKHASPDYSIESPPPHIRHYLVYHALWMACRTSLISRWYWAVAQLVPGAVKARIHVRFNGTTYHWNAIFRRRSVTFVRS